MIILSYGGGKDSTAIVAMDLNRDRAAAFLGIDRTTLDAALPRFDVAVFSDTGAEFEVTYATVARVASVLGDRFARVAREGESIMEWCLRLGIVPLMPGASHICSKKFKGDVLAAWAAREGYHAPTWLIGIEADEGARVKRFQKPADDAAEYRYPLIDLGLNREKLDALLHHLGWPDVHKSSCVFCPFMSEDELREMYHNHPKAWKQCGAIETAFEAASHTKHAAFIAGGSKLNKGGRAFRGQWRQNSFADGARLFVKTVNGKRLTVQEWGDKFANESTKVRE